MYVQHFALKKRPFRAISKGTDVFVGPLTVRAIGGIKNALTGTDSGIAVEGPAGVGKTTLVMRALEGLGSDRLCLTLSRLKLNSDDVLEHLLNELGVDAPATGTIQRFRQFRRALAEQGRPVFVLVEDATRLSSDTLAELEALTAADAGESDGAALVLMGDDRLTRCLQDPALARLVQRLRLRLSISSLSANELRGYLRHSFRLAGREFEELFDDDAAAVLHRLSHGIPRTANNLVESALAAAATQGLQRVPTEMITRVARDEYGLNCDDLPAPAVAPVASVAAIDAVQVPAEIAAASTAEVPPALPADPPAAVAIDVPLVPEAATGFAPEASPAADEPELAFEIDDDIPQLIQDTLPDLDVLAIKAASANAAPTETQEPAEIESSGIDVADWDRDPTFAELKPDLEALEAAMASDVDATPEPPVLQPEPLPEKAAPKPPPGNEIPEITLDHAINQRVESRLIEEPGEPGAPAATSAAGDSPAIRSLPGRGKKADVEIDRISTELARAKSLEDVDDAMAETLFGDELSFAAAELAAVLPASEPPANDALELAKVADPAAHADGADAAYGDSIEVTLAADDDPRGEVDLSASQRLKTVRALNVDKSPTAPPVRDDAAAIQSASPPPESIEDQIDTTMTQTLKALNIAPPLSHDDGEEKRGFFSRFKRS